MGKTISKYQLIESELKYHVERYDSLERHTETLLGEKEEEVGEAEQEEKQVVGTSATEQ